MGKSVSRDKDKDTKKYKGHKKPRFRSRTVQMGKRSDKACNAQILIFYQILIENGK